MIFKYCPRIILKVILEIDQKILFVLLSLTEHSSRRVHYKEVQLEGQWTQPEQQINERAHTLDSKLV